MYVKHGFGVLTTVNAPYREHVDEETLAVCLSSVAAAQNALGQVFSFFTEVSKPSQANFIKVHGISHEGLAKVAAYLSEQSGQDIRPAI